MSIAMEASVAPVVAVTHLSEAQTTSDAQQDPIPQALEDSQQPWSVLS